MGALFEPLSDGVFGIGAHGVPSKSQNPTISDQGGPSSTTTLPNHKWMDLLKKVINKNLLFFYNNFLS